jgi:hypothetical protein
MSSGSRSSRIPIVARAQQGEPALEAIALDDEGNGEGKHEYFETGHGALLIELSRTMPSVSWANCYLRPRT